MAGLFGRVSSELKSKIHAAFDDDEEPNATLALMYEQQIEYLQVLRRKTVAVVKAKANLQRELHQVKADVAKSTDHGQVPEVVSKSQALQDQIAELDLQERQLTAEDQRIASEMETSRSLSQSAHARYIFVQAELELVKMLFAVESLDNVRSWSERERSERLHEVRGGLDAMARAVQMLEQLLTSLRQELARQESQASQAQAANREDLAQMALDHKTKLDVRTQILQLDVESARGHLQQLEAAAQRYATALAGSSVDQ